MFDFLLINKTYFPVNTPSKLILLECKHVIFIPCSNKDLSIKTITCNFCFLSKKVVNSKIINEINFKIEEKRKERKNIYYTNKLVKDNTLEYSGFFYLNENNEIIFDIFGKIYIPNLYIYVGELQYNQIDGFGYLNDYYVKKIGYFKNNIFTYGKLILKNKKTIMGSFNNNTRILNGYYEIIDFKNKTHICSIIKKNIFCIIFSYSNIYYDIFLEYSSIFKNKIIITNFVFLKKQQLIPDHYFGLINCVDNILIYEGVGFIVLNNEINYVGCFKNGKKNGIGFYFTNKYSFYGNFLNNELHGYGIQYSLLNNSTYTGTFEKSKRNGYGELFSHRTDKMLFKGNWKNNKIHGYGVYYWYWNNNFLKLPYFLNKNTKFMIFRGNFVFNLLTYGNVFDESKNAIASIVIKYNKHKKNYKLEFINNNFYYFGETDKILNLNGFGFFINFFDNFCYFGEFFDNYYSNDGFFFKYDKNFNLNSL